MLKILPIIQMQTVFSTVLSEWEKSAFCNACFQTWFVIAKFLTSYLQAMFLEFDSPWVDTKHIRSRMGVSYWLVKKYFDKLLAHCDITLSVFRMAWLRGWKLLSSIKNVVKFDLRAPKKKDFHIIKYERTLIVRGHVILFHLVKDTNNTKW